MFSKIDKIEIKAFWIFPCNFERNYPSQNF